MRIAIFGAGSIGCYVGGRLAAVGADVTFIGRERMQLILEHRGISLTHFNQSQFKVRPDQFKFTQDPSVLKDMDIVILTVKSQDTDTAIKQLKAYMKPRSMLVSLQNGVGNVGRLKAALNNVLVVGGMVPFNVVNQGYGRFHCGTEGDICLQDDVIPRKFLDYLTKSGLPIKLCKDIEGVHWGKLLMNLNNALNVLSDKPLQQQLSDTEYRKVLAMSIAEALRCMDKAKIKPVRVGKVMPRMLPFVLRLPDSIFQILAKGMLKMDPEARSSMWEDLQNKRPPEIEYLNGEIVRLGQKVGVKTPVNNAIKGMVVEAFMAGKSPAYEGGALLAKFQKNT